MLTINAEIKSDGKRSDGTYNVKLRFTLNRKMRRLSTSLFATPKDLTKDLKIKQSSTLKREIDNLVRCYQEKCAKLQFEPRGYFFVLNISLIFFSLTENPYAQTVQNCITMDDLFLS